jgi:hypothetical protein
LGLGIEHVAGGGDVAPVVAAAGVICQFGTFRIGKPVVGVEAVHPFEPPTLLQAVPGQVLGGIERGSGDAGMQVGVAGVAEFPGLGSDLLV